MAWSRSTTSIQFGGGWTFTGALWELDAGENGFLLVTWSDGIITVDGTPYTIDELADNFAIQDVDLMFFGGGQIPDISGIAWGGGNGSESFTLEPVGLDSSTLAFVSSPGYPPYPTKWNGVLYAFLQQLHFYLRFDNVGPLALQATLTPPYVISGANTTIEPPENPVIVGLGALDFGGDTTIQALTDASGIYTLTPGLFRDELWQRVGTTATVTNFAIPRPFFKTGYIGDK